MKPSTLILLSGGLDSAANLALACEAGETPFVLTADYGQRAARSEIRAAARLAEYYGCQKEVLSLQWLGGLGTSALTDKKMGMPEFRQDQLDELSLTTKSAKSVWVPNRNGVLIEVAAAFADARQIGQVLVGFNAEEAVTFPDNTSEYMAAVTKSLSFSTSNHVKVTSYTDRMTKKEIVAKLRSLKKPFPFQLLWSCYQGEEKPCGQCESCQRLERALKGLS